MKPRALVLPVLLALAAPAAFAVVSAPTAAHAQTQDKSKSPAKGDISTLEYNLAEVARLRNLADLPKSAMIQGMLADAIKSSEEYLAKVKKGDPKWDVSAYVTAINGAKAALETAKKGPADTGPSTDKEKSPAKREINDLEYTLKEVSRVRNLANLATSTSAQDLLASEIKKAEEYVGKVKKADPKWDVSPYNTAISGAKAALEAAKKGAPPPATPAGPGGPNKAASAAFNDINMAEVEMKSATNKLAAADFKANNSDAVRKLGDNLTDLDKRIAAIKKADPSWDVKPFTDFSKDAWKKHAAAQKAVDDKNKAISEDIARRSKWETMPDRWGGAVAAGFRVVDKKPPTSIMAVGEDAKRIMALKGLAEECKKEQYELVQAKYATEKREEQPAKVCPMAAGYEKLGKDFVPVAAKAVAEAFATTDKAAIAELTKTGTLTPGVLKSLSDVKTYADGMHKTFNETVKPTNATADRALFAPLEAQGKPFADAMAAAAKVNRFPADHTTQDGVLSAAVQGAVGHIKAQLIKVRVTGANWGVSKNDIGIPTEKWNVGWALVKVQGESHCRAYRVQGSQPYTGGGTYGKATAFISQDAMFKVSSCQ